MMREHRHPLLFLLLVLLMLLMLLVWALLPAVPMGLLLAGRAW